MRESVIIQAKPVFVVGPPRSGTTLVQSILASHSSVDSLPETHFFEDVIAALGDQYFNPNKKFPARGFVLINEALSKAGFEIEWRRLAAELEGAVTKSVFEYLIREYIDPTSEMFVEKTPGHARYIAQIQAFYPDAKFIAIVRHPVESVGSMYNMRPLSLADTRLRYVSSLLELTRLWQECCRTILRNMNNRLKLIKYEELVREPENTVRSLCNFLGIDYEANMLSNFGIVAKRFIRTSFSPWKTEVVSGKLGDNSYKWRRKLQSRKVWLIEEHAGDLLQELGYVRTVCPGSTQRKRALLEESLSKLVIDWKLETYARKCLRDTKKSLSGLLRLVQ